MKKPVSFFVVASDEYKPFADKMIKSLRKFTDKPIKIFGQKDLDKCNSDGYLGSWYAYFGAILSKEYELVINIDADSIVLDNIDEIFEDNYDVAGTLSNYPINQGAYLTNVPTNKYFNVGLLASRSEKFWNDWKMLNMKNMKYYYYGEQDVCNSLLATSEFKVRIFDHEQSGVFYGGVGRPYWPTFRMVDNKVMCENRIVKIIHFAGKYIKKFEYKESGLFDKDVCNYFDKLLHNGLLNTNI